MKFSMNDLPLFRRVAAENHAKTMTAKAHEPKRTWPDDLRAYGQAVYGLLSKYGSPDLPWPSWDQMRQAMDSGIMPNRYAGQIIREDGDECRARYAENEDRQR